MNSFRQRGSSDAGCLILVVLFGSSALCFILANKFWRFEEFLYPVGVILFLLGIIFIAIDKK